MGSDLVSWSIGLVEAKGAGEAVLGAMVPGVRSHNVRGFAAVTPFYTEMGYG